MLLFLLVRSSYSSRSRASAPAHHLAKEQAQLACAWGGVVGGQGLQAAVAATEGGVGLVGLGRGLHRRRAPTASMSFPHQLNRALPRLSGLTAPRLLTAPEPHQGAGGREMPPCLCVRACWGPGGGGGHSRQGHTFVVLQRAVVGACGGLCVPGAPGPNSGAWVPYHVAAEGVCGSGDRQLPPVHD